MNGNRSSYFLLADEIDHLTIRYTDFGERLDRKKGIDMIKFNASAFSEVAAVLKDTDLSYDSLNCLTDENLYKILVKVSSALMDIAFGR